MKQDKIDILINKINIFKMGNNINKIQKIENIEIHTKGFCDNYCFVLVTNYDDLEPHNGEITYTKNNVISEVYAIVKALEYLNFIQIRYDLIRICTSSQGAIDFIEDCIYNKRHDKLVQKILLLLSDKNVKFLHVNSDQNYTKNFID